jgi:VanZ family protein
MRPPACIEAASEPALPVGNIEAIAHAEMGELIGQGQLPALAYRRKYRSGRPSPTLTVALLACAAVLVYLSLRASPRIAEVSWMPRELGRWADHYGVARNAVAFGVFGLVVAVFCRGWRRRSVALLDVVAFAAFAEVVQIWIPSRSSDLKDVGAAFVGVAIAAVVIACFARCCALFPSSGVRRE